MQNGRRDARPMGSYSGNALPELVMMFNLNQLFAISMPADKMVMTVR
jgi:hypothetical protein